MKTLLSAFTIVCLFTGISFSQDALSIRGTKISDGAIFFSITDAKKIRYFTELKNESGHKELKDGKNFSLKENSSNVYFKWLNPTRYRITWKDSLFNDEQDQKVKDFVSLLVAQLGSPVSTLNKSAITSATDFKKFIDKSPQGKIDVADVKNPTQIEIPQFSNIALLEIFLRLRENQNKLTESDRAMLNKLANGLKELDDESSKNIPEMVEKIFSDLYKISDFNKVKEIIETGKGDRDNKINKILKDVSKKQTDIFSQIKDFQTEGDPILGLITKNAITTYFESTVSKLKTDKELVSKLEDIFTLMEKSVSDIESDAGKKGYFNVRDLSFDQGKRLKTNLIISEFEYNKEKNEFTKKQDLITTAMNFRGYDLFALSVSAGIFYSNTVLKSFGVSTKDGKLFVKEDNIEKNEPVLATFLNANVSINSRFISPLVQLGIDPTKKRPFILLGGGFSIPVAKIALSGGWIFTWDQSLDKLVVDKEVESTTTLEKDIKYKFNGLGNKGYYFGIQYNF